MSHTDRYGIVYEIAAVPANMIKVEAYGNHEIDSKAEGQVQLKIIDATGRSDVLPARKYVMRVRTNPRWEVHMICVRTSVDAYPRASIPGTLANYMLTNTFDPSVSSDPSAFVWARDYSQPCIDVQDVEICIQIEPTSEGDKVVVMLLGIDRGEGNGA